MKVILKMFSGSYWEMSSDVVNVPDTTGHELRVSFPSPAFERIVKNPEDSELTTQKVVHCKFVFTGDHKQPGRIRIYKLNRIHGG